MTLDPAYETIPCMGQMIQNHLILLKQSISQRGLNEGTGISITNPEAQLKTERQIHESAKILKEHGIPWTMGNLRDVYRQVVRAVEMGAYTPTTEGDALLQMAEGPVLELFEDGYVKILSITLSEGDFHKVQIFLEEIARHPLTPAPGGEGVRIAMFNGDLVLMVPATALKPGQVIIRAR